jgi:hypothetical protein
MLVRIFSGLQAVCKGSVFKNPEQIAALAMTVFRDKVFKKHKFRAGKQRRLPRRNARPGDRTAVPLHAI